MKFSKVLSTGVTFILGPAFSVRFTQLRTWQRINWITSSYKSVVQILSFHAPGVLQLDFSLPPAVQTVQGSLDLRRQSRFSSSIQLKSFICEHYILKWFLNHSVSFVIFFHLIDIFSFSDILHVKLKIYMQTLSLYSYQCFKYESVYVFCIFYRDKGLVLFALKYCLHGSSNALFV